MVGGALAGCWAIGFGKKDGWGLEEEGTIYRCTLPGNGDRRGRTGLGGGRRPVADFFGEMGFEFENWGRGEGERFQGRRRIRWRRQGVCGRGFTVVEDDPKIDAISVGGGFFSMAVGVPNEKEHWGGACGNWTLSVNARAATRVGAGIAGEGVAEDKNGGGGLAKKDGNGGGRNPGG